MKYRLFIDDGYASSRHPRSGIEIEVPDDATEEEIEEIGRESFFSEVNYSFVPDEG